MIYNGSKANEISFPLGGIGTGSIGLDSGGRLVDWEIYNRPNKGSFNGFSHFAVKAESDSVVLDARVLNGDFHGSCMGVYSTVKYDGYGFGPDRNLMTGVPHFREVEFKGEFPIAELKFSEENFPGDVRLCAFNPFIPTTDMESSLPSAFFEVSITNDTSTTLNYTVCLSVSNPFFKDDSVNRYGFADRCQYIALASDRLQPEELTYSNLTVATDSDIISYQEYWHRGGWFDNLGVFWRDLTNFGAFKNRITPLVILVCALCLMCVRLPHTLSLRLKRQKNKICYLLVFP